MKRTTLFSVCSALVAASVMSVAGYGCGDDDDNVVTKPDTGTGSETGTGTETGAGPETGTGTPAAPTLGAQIDRMGRPAVNTALNNTFEANDTTAGTAKDAWNANAASAGWGAAYGAEVSKNLAIYDGLDRNCGNQAAASQDAGATTNAAKYGALGGVLANDKLWLNTAGTTGVQYLAVELAATGIAPAAATDQGGRRLPFDVIDITYSALAAGALTGVGDDIAADPTKTGGTTFPYLAAPK